MIPIVLDDVSEGTERAGAAEALLIGVTQAGLASQTAASRASVAKATADSLNNTPLGTAPGLPVNSSGVIPLYVQPDYRNPPQRAGGVVTAANPLGQ